MTDIKVGDKVIVVDDSDGTMNPVKECVKEIKQYKRTKNPKTGKWKRTPTGKVTKITVPAVLVKGKTYVIAGVTRPPHDTPDRPLILLKDHEDLGWWKQWRFKKTGEATEPVKNRRFKKKGK